MKTVTVALIDGTREAVEVHDGATIELHMERRHVSIAMPEDETRLTHVWWDVRWIRIDRDGSAVSSAAPVVTE